MRGARSVDILDSKKITASDSHWGAVGQHPVGGQVRRNRAGLGVAGEHQSLHRADGLHRGKRRLLQSQGYAAGSAG